MFFHYWTRTFYNSTIWWGTHIIWVLHILFEVIVLSNTEESLLTTHSWSTFGAVWIDFFTFARIKQKSWPVTNQSMQNKWNVILNLEIKVFPFNSFSTNVPLLHPLKTWENLQFSDICREYRSGTLVENGLINYWITVLPF